LTTLSCFDYKSTRAVHDEHRCDATSPILADVALRQRVLEECRGL